MRLRRKSGGISIIIVFLGLKSGVSSHLDKGQEHYHTKHEFLCLVLAIFMGGVVIYLLNGDVTMCLCAFCSVDVVVPS